MTTREWNYLWIGLLAAACAPTTNGPSRADGGVDGASAEDGGGAPMTEDDAGPRLFPGCAGTYELSEDDCETRSPELMAMDSDSDGLTDFEELCTHGTDPCEVDSDGDGFTDLAEVAAGTDPSDASVGIPPEDFFVVLPYEGPGQERTLRFATDISQADVYFLVDMTGSMRGERTNLINGLVDVIIPGVQSAIPDVEFGVGGLDDYPYSSYGSGNDLPYYNLRDIAPFDDDRGGWSIAAGPTACPSNPASNDIGAIVGAPNGRPDILEAVEGLPCHGGFDGPESYVPALWATATGEGLSWPTGSIPGNGGCPTVLDEEGERRGYPCFRPGSLPIVLLFGDFSFHNSPTGAASYSFPAPSYAATTDALGAIGARVMGIFSGTTGRADYEAVARDTGAVRSDGSPLVFDIASNGSGLDTTVVNAVRELVGGTPQDVSTETRNVDGNPDDFDARLFIQAIVPVEGYNGGLSGPMPGVTYTSRDDTTFRAVIPGTQVEFAIDFFNDVRPPADTAQIFRARILVIGNGVATLDMRQVYIIVPPDGGTVLI
jgi:hypothetical protein